MKKIILTIIFSLGIVLSSFAWNVSGVAVDSETGDPLPGIEINLLLETGLVRFTNTLADGTFSFDNIPDGDHEMEFHYYEPVVINGVYYLRTVYDDTITVNGSDVTGIIFEIDPHYPHYHVSGTLYNAMTMEPITVQQVSLRLDFASHSGFFFAWSDSTGNYSFYDSVPDWTYTFNAFANDYYYGEEMELVIDTTGPQDIEIDFYLDPKSGVKVTGKLYDVETNEPILIAGRTVRITAINSYFAHTDSTGEFTFVNVTPGYYANITVTTQDTSYINCPESTIRDFTVPDGGATDVELFQEKFESVHEVMVDDNSYQLGETKTLRFSLVYDDDVYGEIWGVELHLPPGITSVYTSPFINQRTDITAFEREMDCSNDKRLVWEGYHSVFGAGNQGNLQYPGDTVYADVELTFDTTASDSDTIGYEIYYSYLCTGGPFSFGDIRFNLNDPFSIGELHTNARQLEIYPNPADEKITFRVNLVEPGFREVKVYDMTGKLVTEYADRQFVAGQNELAMSTVSLPEGIYFVVFSSMDLNLTRKMIICRD